MANAAANSTRARRTSIQEQDELLETIYRAHAARLRGRLCGRRGTRPSPTTSSSEAFLRLASALRAGRAPHDPPAWLHRVAMNLVVSRARRNTVAIAGDAGLLDRGIAASPEDEALDHERDELVHEALGTLTRAGPHDRHDGCPRLSPRGDRRNDRQDRPGDANPPVPGARPAPHAARARRPVDVT